MAYFPFCFDVRDDRLGCVLFADLEVIVDVSRDRSGWSVDGVWLGKVDEFGRLSADAVELSGGEASARRLWADAHDAAMADLNKLGHLWRMADQYFEEAA